MKRRFLWKKNPPDEGSSTVAPSLPRGVIITSSPCTWSMWRYIESFAQIPSTFLLHFIMFRNSLHLIHVALSFAQTLHLHVALHFITFHKFTDRICQDQWQRHIPQKCYCWTLSQNISSKSSGSEIVLPGGCIVQGWCSAVGAPGNWHPCISVQVFFVVKPSNLLRL